MLPDFYQIFSVTADFVLFIFVGYYLLRLREREKELEKKETQTDTDYHHVVDEALNKERQIIADATSEADNMLLDTKMIHEASQASVDHALTAMMAAVEKDTTNAAETYRTTYQTALKQITDQSLKDFQTISTELQETLQKEAATFHTTLLPALQKELDAYKQSRMQQTEQMIAGIIQKASQEILNKSISLEDHQKLLRESLEKAKREGMFA